MTVWRVARLVAAKDLRVEARSRVVLNQVVPFAAIVMVLFAFALDDDAVHRRVAPGLVWLATLFSLVVVVQRSFAIEQADGALDALRVAGVRPAGIFLGKSLALALQLVVLEVLLVLAALVLFAAQLHWEGVALMAVVAVAATPGLAFVGTIYGGLAAGATGRETLLPLLLLPVVAPVLIGATRSTEAALNVGGTTMQEGWAWVAMLATFTTLFGIGGSVAFGAMVEEQ